jgi:hypothetical protein
MVWRFPVDLWTKVEEIPAQISQVMRNKDDTSCVAEITLRGQTYVYKLDFYRQLNYSYAELVDKNALCTQLVVGQNTLAYVVTKFWHNLFGAVIEVETTAHLLPGFLRISLKE